MPRIQNPDWQRESYPYGYFYKQGITNDTSIINIPLQKGLYFMVEKAVIRLQCPKCQHRRSIRGAVESVLC